MTPLQEAAYRHLLSLLPPGRYPREGGAADGMVQMLGGLEAKLLEELFRLLAEAFPQSASEGGLGELALARGLHRLPGEYLEAFRQRVRLARLFWEKAGTLRGLLLWLRAAGYQATVREHYLDDPAIWAEFSVYLWPEISNFITDRWDDGVGGVGRWHYVGLPTLGYRTLSHSGYSQGGETRPRPSPNYLVYPRPLRRLG
ncbi:hypothetical protein AN926_06070 [Thermus scotoductus]|uniref:DUF2313 domain-containing protein n=1 Tax=Thermus scotoductus TaxID=37636 RepID=A0A0N0ZR92_THESC|nr:hypothetical protein AN926_06070 [Thermus scotoductus]